MSALPERAFDVLAMTPGDLDAVMAIENRIYPSPWTRGNFVDSLAAGYDAWRFVAPAGPMLGYAVLMWALDEVHLLNLAVDAPYQGRRLGGSMLSWLIDDCARRGAASLLLEVRPSNEPAIALYRRFGLARIGFRRGYYPAVDGMREDAIVMRMPIAAPPRAGAADA